MNVDNKKGLSLPLVVGLLTVLMVGAVASNGLVVRNLQGTRQIESATRAYLFAEGGIENALYELSAHAPGYETPDLDKPARRCFSFITAPVCLNSKWRNEWTIQSHLVDQRQWQKLYPDNKAIINLFNDIDTSATHDTSDIRTLTNSDFTLIFQIPQTFRTSGGGEFGTLAINNDFDEEMAAGRTPDINEDRPGPRTSGTCPPGTNDNDDDCDGKIDEDNKENPVLYWKLFDDTGRILTPLPGCIIDDPANKSEICEKDFNTTNLDMRLTADTVGSYLDSTQASSTSSIREFIRGTEANAKLVMEVFLVAPLEDASNPARPIKIPYLEYKIETSGRLPDPYFTIKSDGYDGDFKQSITAQVKPKYLSPLFDFTILQQE